MKKENAEHKEQNTCKHPARCPKNSECHADRCHLCEPLTLPEPRPLEIDWGFLDDYSGPDDIGEVIEYKEVRHNPAKEFVRILSIAAPVVIKPIEFIFLVISYILIAHWKVILCLSTIAMGVYALYLLLQFLFVTGILHVIAFTLFTFLLVLSFRGEASDAMRSRRRRPGGNITVNNRINASSSSNITVNNHINTQK